MIRIFALIVILLIALAWITQIRERFLSGKEYFTNASEYFTNDIGGVNMSPTAADALQKLLASDTSGLAKDPAALLKRVREMLEKVDNPALWDRAISLSDKDPGQLARMNLGLA